MIPNNVAIDFPRLLLLAVASAPNGVVREDYFLNRESGFDIVMFQTTQALFIGLKLINLPLALAPICIFGRHDNIRNKPYAGSEGSTHRLQK